MVDTHTAAASSERTRSHLVEAASASWLPWLVGRCIVLVALGAAHLEVSHFHHGGQKAVLQVHAGLLGWDAGWYTSIASHGYQATNEAALRFFPLYPLLITGLHHVTYLTYSASAVAISNVFAFGATVVIYLLTRSELDDPGLARTAAWLLNLAPPAFAMVMGYSDPLLIFLALCCFLCLRRRWWLAAGALGYLAGTARPIGFVLVVPALFESLTAMPVNNWRTVGSRLVAIVAPAAGLVTFLAWSQAAFGTFSEPLTAQESSARHGGLTDPVVTMYHDGIDLLHGHHVGTGLHMPWVLLCLILLVIAFRVLPVSYGLFSLGILAVAVTGANLDSFERYALSAFPLPMAATTLLRSRDMKLIVLVLSGAAMFGYAVLAFVGSYVP